MNEIKILHTSYISPELIQEFTDEIGPYEQTVSFERHQQEEKYINFTGPDLSDIIIFIRQHPTEIMVTGFIVPMIYDIIKVGVPKLWAHFSKKPVMIVSGNRQKEKTKRISLLIKKEDAGVEVILEGDVDGQKAERLIKMALMYCNSDEMQQDLVNEAFHEKPGEYKIRIAFNERKNSWEPKNFSDYRNSG